MGGRFSGMGASLEFAVEERRGLGVTRRGESRASWSEERRSRSFGERQSEGG